MIIKQVKVGELQTNCYILKTENEALIIDPGGDAEKILENIENQEVKILNTHYHFDHTIANDILKEKLNAEILIHENEKEFIDFEADRFLKEGEFLKIGETSFKIINTPGHTKGSICLIGEEAVFTGDTLFDGGYGRTDLPGGEPEKMIESLKKLEHFLKNGVTIYPGHGEPFKWKD